MTKCQTCGGISGAHKTWCSDQRRKRGHLSHIARAIIEESGVPLTLPPPGAERPVRDDDYTPAAVDRDEADDDTMRTWLRALGASR